MNSIFYFYNYFSQWCYEIVMVEELLLLMVDKFCYIGYLIDFNVCVECMGWLLFVLQLGINLLIIVGEVEKVGMNLVDYMVKFLKEGFICFVVE